MRIAAAEAQTRLWELIEAAQAGEDIVIVDEDGDAVRLVPILQNISQVESRDPL